MRKTFFLLFLFLLSVTMTWGQVEAPNYDFSLDTLSDFYPGKSLENMKKKYGKAELAFDKGASKVYKFYVSHIRYKFPVFVRIFKNESVGFFARLPSYFLHDVFHQSLINRYGKQDEYSKVAMAGIYIWKDEKGIKLIYQGQCTITCFPMYLAGEAVQPPEGFPGSAGLLKELKVDGYTQQ